MIGDLLVKHAQQRFAIAFFQPPEHHDKAGVAVHGHQHLPTGNFYRVQLPAPWLRALWQRGIVHPTVRLSLMGGG